MGDAFFCEHCGQKYRLSDRLAGLRVCCRTCGKTMDVPTFADAERDATSPSAKAHQLGDVLDDALRSSETRRGASRSDAGDIGPEPRRRGVKASVRRSHASENIERTLGSRDRADVSTFVTGAVFSALGIGGFLIPSMGPRFAWIQRLGALWPIVAAILGLIGAYYFCRSSRNRAIGAPLAACVVLSLFVVGWPDMRRAGERMAAAMRGELGEDFQRFNDRLSRRDAGQGAPAKHAAAEGSSESSAPASDKSGQAGGNELVAEVSKPSLAIEGAEWRFTLHYVLKDDTFVARKEPFSLVVRGRDRAVNFRFNSEQLRSFGAITGTGRFDTATLSAPYDFFLARGHAAPLTEVSNTVTLESRSSH